jgi:phage terminase small subunit
MRPSIIKKELEQPLITPKARLLAKYIAEGRPIVEAARLAGYDYKQGSLYKMINRPDFQAFIKKMQARNERVVDLSRKRVMEGFLEAIEQAKLMAEPMTQIAGWREVAKMCGYYAPEVKILNINQTSQRYLTQLETMSDSDLLGIIEKDSELIQGEAELLLEGPEGAEPSAEPSEGAEGTPFEVLPEGPEEVMGAEANAEDDEPDEPLQFNPERT